MVNNKWLLILCLLCTSCFQTDKVTDGEETVIVYSSIGASPLDDIEERKFSLMEREIEYLMTLWPGEYDNVEQLSFEKDVGRNSIEKGQHKRIHSTVTQVFNKDLSEYLLYVEEYQNNDSTSVYRQQIYELLPEDETKSIRIRIYNLKNGEKMWRSQDVLTQIKGMNKSGFLPSKSCDLILQREGKEFIGKTDDSDCVVNEARDIGSFQIKISTENYGFRYFNLDNQKKNILADDSRENWYILDKARCFICMIDFPREPGGRPVNTKYYVELHDQGGQFEFDYDDGRHMVLTMRNTWSYGMQRNTFVIVIQEESLEGPTLIYSWGSDGADRIGMNPGWIRVQCDIKNTKNVKLQQALRPDS